MAIPQTMQVPYKDKIMDDGGYFTRGWVEFFQRLKEIVDPLGIEKTFELLNNQAAPVKINGLVFNGDAVKQVFIDYLIQRVTSTTELIETGVLRLVYLPSSLTWNVANMGGQGPGASGIVFSTNADGEILYTSTNVGGAAITSKISVRNRTLSGKNRQL